MSSFILIHGSGQNAGAWSRVGRLLEERGHVVVTPDLPKRATGWGLEQHGAAIAAAAPGPGAVLVAHSLSGVFLPLAVEACRGALLVFLAAVIPERGKSVRQQFADDPSMFAPEWIAAGARWFDRSQQESLARQFLFHDCDGETLAWALGTVDPLDAARVVVEPSEPARWADVPAAAIVASRDRTLAPDWCRRASRRLLGREAIEVDAGHCPHASRPGEIADILERLARQAGA
jgi:pimeloyl-ACP methyl ester carboxylesterase